MAGYVDPAKEDLACFREMQREGPLQMLNLLRFREVAAYDDGTAACCVIRNTAMPFAIARLPTRHVPLFTCRHSCPFAFHLRHATIRRHSERLECTHN